MIDFIRGVLVSKQPTRVVIDVSGVGYGLNIPLSTYARLSGVDCTQELLTILHVREDAFLLYGFYSEDERELFKLLLNVSGIGPRMALGILSAVEAGEFAEAVRSENIALLVSIPGVGKKKAERLLLELKDKICLCMPAGKAEKPPAALADEGIFKDAAEALVTLGCGSSGAAAAVRRAKESLGGRPSLEEIIKEALKNL